jgi:transposase-like protein
MAWTDEQKEQAKQMYLDGNPTPENSIELVKQIADALDQSPNGVRMLLSQANLYVKKAEGSTATKPATKKTADGEGTKRVSKDVQLAELRAAIEAKGATVDEEIVGKLTGKAAAYFTQVLAS